MRYRTSIAFCLLAAAASAASCSSGQSTSAASSLPGEGTHLNAEALTLTSLTAIPPSQSLKLLASVVTQAGSTFEFYDDATGNVLYSEFGGNDVNPINVSPKGLSPSQVWAHLAPGVPVPNSITDAEALSAASAANDAPASAGMPATGSQPGTGPRAPPPAGLLHTENASPPPGNPNQFCSGAWAYNNLSTFSSDCDGIDKYNWCWYDTGPGGWSQGNNVYADTAAICNANSSSDIFLNVNRNNSQGGASWSIPSQSWRWYSHSGGTCCLGLCTCNYNVEVTNPGSWGDLQFAGGFEW